MFDNHTIEAPIKSKPHIVFRDGYWRVCTFDFDKGGEYRNRWHRAHLWAEVQNGLFQKKLRNKSVTVAPCDC